MYRPLVLLLLLAVVTRETLALNCSITASAWTAINCQGTPQEVVPKSGVEGACVLAPALSSSFVLNCTTRELYFYQGFLHCNGTLPQTLSNYQCHNFSLGSIRVEFDSAAALYSSWAAHLLSVVMAYAGML